MSIKLSAPEYWRARQAHAFLMRLEGETFQKIGNRFGVTRERARGMVHQGTRMCYRSMRRTRFVLQVEICP